MKSPHPSLSLPGRPQLFLVIPTALDGSAVFSFPQPLPRATTVLSFVISTGAYPDFLLRAASDVHVCGSPQREPHTDHQSHGSPQEIRGSAVERSAVSPSHTRCCGPQPHSPLSSRPERTRISYFALLATSTYAALRRESRMQIIKATGLHRKSGGAQWRDPRFLLPTPAAAGTR